MALCGTVDILAEAVASAQLDSSAPREDGAAQPHAEREEYMELPLADLVWRLHQPDGYEVVRAGGTVVTDDIRRPLPAAVEVAGILYDLTGGFIGSPLALSARQAARVP